MTASAHELIGRTVVVTTNPDEDCSPAAAPPHATPAGQRAAEVEIVA